MHQEIDIDQIRSLVREHSRIDDAYAMQNGVARPTFLVEIPADCFLPWAHKPHRLVQAVSLYASLLYREIQDLAVSSALPSPWLMSEAHIRNETLAHLIPWFLYARRKGKGKIWNSCKEINLNVDEARRSVRFLMFFASLLR